MAVPILKTRLLIPSRRSESVARPHLIERLDAGMERKVTLVSAPAGFGKTTLLAEWVNCCQLRVAGYKLQEATANLQPSTGNLQHPTHFAWLSLSEGDNDPARFWSYVVAALQTIDPDAGKSALLMLQPGAPAALQPLGEAFLIALINDLAGMANFALILDDLHLVGSQEIHEALVYLVDNMPPQMHLVVSGRADPPWPLARMRARGELVELRLNDLRFTAQETLTFLNDTMRLDLPPGSVSTLRTRTEGWIAGLQVAALSLQRRRQSSTAGDVAAFIDLFAGSDRYIFDYLVEEVLDRQPPQIQTFLLHTSILDALTAPLCDAVVAVCDPAGSDSQAVLQALERANLFIIPLDNERQWYRYHRLFADLLQKRLQQIEPGLAPILHGRASVWYEQADMMPEAIGHALSAGDFERAAGLIDQQAEAALMRSELTSLLGWIDALPEQMVRTHPSLSVYYAWALLFGGRPLEKIESYLEQASAGPASAQAAPLRAFIALFQGQMAQAAEWSRYALERLPQDGSFLHSAALFTQAFATLADGHVAAGIEMLRQVAQLSHKSGNVMTTVMITCQQAELMQRQGRLAEARAIYEQALDMATDSRGHRLPIACQALTGLGELWREWDDLEQARRCLAEGIELAMQWGEIGALDGYLSQAHLRQAQGDVPGVRQAMQKARDLAIRFDTTEQDDILVAAHQAHLWMDQSGADPACLEAVAHWAADRELTTERCLSELQERLSGGWQSRHRRTLEYTAFTRLLVTQGRSDEALAVLEWILKIASQWQLNERIIHAQALRALAFQERGQAEQALDALERALAVAEPAGYVRTFVDLGEPMARLLRQAAARKMVPHYVDRLLAAGAFEPGCATPASVGPPPTSLDALSERELEVLRLLPTRLSTPEIAAELVVSVHTVRSHIKHIYDKLGVHRRADAVQRAHELNLL